MSAFAPEWQVLLKSTAGQKEYRLNGKRFVTGKLAGKDVVLVLSGISMVNAAMTAQEAIDRSPSRPSSFPALRAARIRP